MTLPNCVSIPWRRILRAVVFVVFIAGAAGSSQAQEYAFVPILSEFGTVSGLAKGELGSLHLSTPVGGNANAFAASRLNPAQYGLVQAVEGVAGSYLGMAANNNWLVPAMGGAGRLVAKSLSGSGSPLVTVANISASAVAIGADGVVYALSGSQIRRYSPGFVWQELPAVPFGIAIQMPASLAVDGAGSLYVGAQPESPIYKFTPGQNGYTRSVVANLGLAVPGLVADGAGTLYAATWAGGSSDEGIYQFTPDGAGSYTQTFIARFPLLRVISIDSAGDLFFVSNPVAYKRVVGNAISSSGSTDGDTLALAATAARTISTWPSSAIRGGSAASRRCARSVPASISPSTVSCPPACICWSTVRASRRRRVRRIRTAATTRLR